MAAEAGARTSPNTLPETVLPPSSADGDRPLIAPWPYAFVKRVIDLASVICLVLALSPLLALVALIVAIDVGLPVVFWQQRPGRHGRPFKLFKFRTMRPGHDAQGNRIADELRSSEHRQFFAAKSAR